MRILHVIHQFPPYSIGGSETYTWELIKEQQKRHEVCLFSAIRDSSKQDYTIINDCYDGIPVTRIVNNYRGISSFREGYDHPKIDEQFDQLIQGFQPDLVHIHHLSNLSFGIVRLLKEKKIPIVMTLHDFWMVCPRGQRLRPDMGVCPEVDLSRCAGCVAPWLEGWQYPQETHEDYIHQRYDSALEILEQIDLLVAPSLFAKEEFVQLGISPSRIVVLDYGRNTQRFQSFSKRSNGEKRIGYLGTLIPSKGVHVLLSAWESLKDEKAVLRIYGADLPYDGWDQYGARLREQYRAHPTIQWMGSYLPHDVPNILSMLDVMVVPSLFYETSSLVIQEAMLTKTWVIASKIGGLTAKICDGINGNLFEPGNVIQLHQLLKQYLTELSEVPKPKEFLPVTPIEIHQEQLVAWYRKVT